MHKPEFLGHVVSADGVEPMWDKVKAINNLPRPTEPSEVRSFIGMANYFYRFLDHFLSCEANTNGVDSQGDYMGLG
jgi:hypothetical protein